MGREEPARQTNRQTDRQTLEHRASIKHRSHRALEHCDTPGLYWLFISFFPFFSGEFVGAYIIIIIIIIIINQSSKHIIISHCMHYCVLCFCSVLGCLSRILLLLLLLLDRIYMLRGAVVCALRCTCPCKLYDEWHATSGRASSCSTSFTRITTTTSADSRDLQRRYRTSGWCGPVQLTSYCTTSVAIASNSPLPTHSRKARRASS
ncbi:uncharacterized protein K452DRAFT_16262 [Aplosporella prunicola CBS 121167]|uniref:Uncharacterized protein n=1 Tax=Aplosporella prunicola CBS 121167 TaxID=1176127 RepID=A0A6A6AWD9_9PEZI|nr:uncharacterized protein K452DRAFT_16262 [Aplosporella prunicola CBS 121167]KAF2135503.1 hypothetical protein K452DRAFT_16262 [Aplosporella prunicola CBS 121167]